MQRTLIAAFLLLGLGLVAKEAQAQTGTARGKVLDAQGQPIPDAKVLIEFMGGVTRKFEVKTNKKGEYMQVGMQPGPYRFTASKEGYQSGFADQRISLGDPTPVPDFKLITATQAAQQAGGGEAAALRGSFGKAVELQSAGKFDEAEAAYKAILVTSPDIPEVYQNLGQIYLSKKDYPAAETAFQKGLELRPDSSDMSTQLARVYQESGQPEKAMALIEKSAGDNPQDAKAQFNRGIFLLNANRNEEAICAFQKAIEADPSSAEALYHMGALMVGQSKIPEAVAFLQQFLCSSPTTSQNVTTAEGLLKALGAKKSDCAIADPTHATYLKAIGAKQSAACANAGATLTTYGALVEGMALAEVRKVVQSPGEEASRTGNLVTFVWKAKDGGLLIAIFDNDRLVSKSQSNLK